MNKDSQTIGYDNKKGPIISITIAIIFISLLVLGYYFLVINAPPEGFSSLYLLDEQKKTEAYPKLLIIDKNNTFNVWVGVKNHKGSRQTFEVQQKLTTDPILASPIDEEVIDRFSITLENQETWEAIVTTTIFNPGNYSLVFELYPKEEGEVIGINIEPENYVLLNIEVDYQNQE